MKKAHCILFAALTIVFYNVSAFAQSNATYSGEPLSEPFKGSVSLEAGEKALKDLPIPMGPRQINSPRVMDEIIRRSRAKTITVNIEELNKASAALSSAAHTAQNDKSTNKKTAKLAKKVARLSKDLRKNILEMKPTKVEPAALAANVGISEFVENIETLIKEVTQKKDRLLYVIDVAHTEESAKKLEAVESQALGIAAVLR